MEKTTKRDAWRKNTGSEDKALRLEMNFTNGWEVLENVEEYIEEDD